MWEGELSSTRKKNQSSGGGMWEGGSIPETRCSERRKLSSIRKKNQFRGLRGVRLENFPKKNLSSGDEQRYQEQSETYAGFDSTFTFRQVSTLFFESFPSAESTTRPTFRAD